MVVQVVKGLTELSQLVMVPVFPLKVNVPLVEPEQMVDPPVTLPPADGEVIVTVVADEVAGAHDPFCTIAWNIVVCVNAPDVYVELVLVILVQVVNGLTELSHPVMVPVFPDNVKVPLVAPEQMVDPPVTLPPTDPGFTVTVVADEVADAHDPL